MNQEQTTEDGFRIVLIKVTNLKLREGGDKPQKNKNKSEVIQSCRVYKSKQNAQREKTDRGRGTIEHLIDLRVPNRMMEQKRNNLESLWLKVPECLG